MSSSFNPIQWNAITLHFFLDLIPNARNLVLEHNKTRDLSRITTQTTSITKTTWDKGCLGFEHGCKGFKVGLHRFGLPKRLKMYISLLNPKGTLKIIFRDIKFAHLCLIFFLRGFDFQPRENRGLREFCCWSSTEVKEKGLMG